MEETAAEAPGPQIIEAGSRRLRVLDLGAGEATPIVLVHGFGGDLNTWMFIQPTLAEGRRAIAFDLPGHGGSEKQVSAGDVDALTAVLGDVMTALGIERAHLVGHSMGGAIAGVLALHQPERVASLSLVAPSGLGPEINAAFIDAFVHVQRRREAQEMLAQLVYDPALVSRTMVEEVLRYKRLDGVQAALETIAGAWFPGGRQALSLMPALAQSPVPVQLLWGRGDRIIPVAHAEALSARMPVHVIDEAGHLLHLEKAAEAARLIRQFIESHA